MEKIGFLIILFQQVQTQKGIKTIHAQYRESKAQMFKSNKTAISH
jgi:hypothetical protein